jgi:hypothetical protein
MEEVMNKSIFKILFLMVICFLLFACSRITQENFEKIKPGMTSKEVMAILGEPTSSDSVNIAGVSGTASIWKDRHAEIDIQFLNDKVLVKFFNKANESNQQRE